MDDALKDAHACIENSIHSISTSYTRLAHTHTESELIESVHHTRHNNNNNKRLNHMKGVIISGAH